MAAKTSASAKAALKAADDGLVRVEYTKEHAGHSKGEVRRVDPISAASLVKAKVAKRAGDPDPVDDPEDPDVTGDPAAGDPDVTGDPALQ